MRPGATGTKQGPLGMQVVPTLPIIQFAIGIQAMNAARYINPSVRLVAIYFLPLDLDKLVVSSCRHSRFHGGGLVTDKPISPNPASRTCVAAIPPGMTTGSVPVVTRVGMLHDQFNKRGPAQITCEFPRVRLVDPHQW